MSKKCKILFFVIAIFTFLCINVFAQTCMFVCSTDPLTTGDQVIFDKLKEWGYTPTAVLSSDLASYVEADYEPYDFIFASESVGSSSLAPLKLIPKPLVNSEGWAAKPSALAWCDPCYAGGGPPEPVVIVDDTGHPLAAGYNTGDVLDLCTDPAALIVPQILTIDVIPIAGLASDPSKLLVFGIEKGTTLTDGSITGNRAASVNIHEFGYPYLTDAALAFYQAAIRWILQGSGGGEKCMFVVAQNPLTTGDQIIHDKLVEWGYHVTPVVSSELVSFILADYEPYDFIFTSESVGSSSLTPLKLIPKPLVNSEAWAAKPTALAWMDPASSDALPPEPIVILDEAAGHPLAAGYSPGDVLDLCSGDPAALAVYIIPTIDVIPIAGLVSDPSKLLIFGIESGTTLIDGSITGNRAASIGIHEFGYPSITEAGWAFYDAAIKWVTKTDSTNTDIHERNSEYLVDFKLAQNYPNPFNPSTKIVYHIPYKSKVRIVVYNIVGRKIAELIDEEMSAGRYELQFNGSGLSSGIYFVRLWAGLYDKTIKILLTK